MSDAAPLTPTGPLPEYGGQPVMRTVIALRNAGDGLSAGMAIDPELLPIGSTVHVVTECVVVAHNHKPLRGGTPDYLELEQVLSAGTAVLVAPDLVAEVLDRQRTKLMSAKEAAAGVGHLPVAGYDEDMLAAHDAGLHAVGLVPGCVECDTEAGAAQRETVDAPLPEGDQAGGSVTPMAGRPKRTRKAT